ncbi:MAG: energy transducer TonB [Bacteroidota bacterium]
MKQLFFVSVLLFLLSCSENKTVEIIPNYEAEFAEIPNPALFQKTESNGIYAPVDKFTIDENTSRLEYRVFLDENGNVAKIKILHYPITLSDEANIKIMESWKFPPQVINGVNSKVRFDVVHFNEKMIESDEVVFIAVEEMPSPVGGMKAIQEKIVYPEIAKRAGIQGRVFIKAVVNSKGAVVKTELIKGIGAGCDQAAMNAVQQTMFTPGKQRGKAVSVQITVPIQFRLE